jgi:hypothetical protein
MGMVRIGWTSGLCNGELWRWIGTEVRTVTFFQGFMAGWGTAALVLLVLHEALDRYLGGGSPRRYGR